MHFTNPAALWYLLALAIPLLLARRRRPPIRRPVANLHLWRAQSLPASANVKRRPPLHWITAVQIAFIGASIFALAGPVLERRSGIALIVDVSASMGADDRSAAAGASRASTTRLAEAIGHARAIAGRLPPRSRVRLIAAGASPKDLGEYVASDPALGRRLDRLSATAAPADLPAAIALATTSGIQPANIHVLTDGPPHAAASGRSDVAWKIVGHSVNNLAVSQLVARRATTDGTDGQLLVEVRNHATVARETEIEIAQDGRVVRRATVRVPAHGAETVVSRMPLTGRVLSARLVDAADTKSDDALAVDNARFALIPPAQRLRVAVFEAPAPSQADQRVRNDSTDTRDTFFTYALSVNRDVSIERPRPETLRDFDVIVCNQCGELPPTRSSVLMIPAATASLEPGLLTVDRPEHPIAAAMEVDGVVAKPFAATAAADDSDVILRAGGVPIVIASERHGRRVVEFRFDVTSSPLALTPAFPILIANTIDWLALRHANRGGLVAGEPLHWLLGDRTSVHVTGPDGRALATRVHENELTTIETELAGVYRVHSDSGDEVFVVNPAVDSESDLTVTNGSQSIPQPVERGQSSSNQTPIAQLFVLIALVLLGIESWYRWRSIANRSAEAFALQARRAPALRWRVATAVCLLLALIRLAVPLGRGPIVAVAALDRSASVSPASQRQSVARVNAMAATMRADDRMGVVAFGGDAVVETGAASQAHLAAIAATVNQAATDIEAGLRVARQTLPTDGERRILLFSDGKETTGDARRQAEYAVGDGIRVDVVPAVARRGRERPRIGRVVAPVIARIDEPIAVSVDIQGSAHATARLIVYRDDQVVSTRPITLPPNGEATISFTDRHRQAGVHVYRASIDSADDEPDEGAAGAVLVATGESRALYVSDAAGSLPSVLASAGFHVTLATPGSIQIGGARLADYDVIVVDDVPAERLTSAELSAIARHVEDGGGGLLLLGSSRSLNASGYPAGPLGSALPIDLRPRNGQRAPSAALALVVDKSGSMADLAGGTPKIEIAREAIRRVLDLVPASDFVGAIAFDTEPSVITPLARAHEPGPIVEKLQRLDARGGTTIAPAVELALRWLRDPSVATLPRRQILLVTDGRTSPADAAGLRAAVNGSGVQVSVVATGQNADRNLLRELAESTGGRAYFPGDMRELPSIVAREATRSAAGATVTERFRARAMSPHPVLTGIDLGSSPLFDGYVVGAAKPGATSILNSHLDDPILCAWRAGLGKVAVFTAALPRWSQAPRLWAQTARWLSRQATDRSLNVELTETGRGVHIAVDADARDGAFPDLVDAHAIVKSPDGEPRQMPLRATAPGQYAADLAASRTGPYVVTVEARDREHGVELRETRGLFWSADRERRTRGTDLGFLKRLAETTGGHVLDPAEDIFAGPRPLAYRDVSGLAAAAALWMFLIELVFPGGIDWRRLAVAQSRRSSREQRASGGGRAAEKTVRVTNV